MPKRPITGFMQFANKSYSTSSGKLVEQAKEASLKWKEMTEAQKAPYNKLGENDRLRYKKEKDELNQKGFFINKDGKSSKDLFLREQKKQIEVKPKGRLSAYMCF